MAPTVVLRSPGNVGCHGRGYIACRRRSMSRSVVRSLCVLLILGAASACSSHEPTAPARAPLAAVPSIEPGPGIAAAASASQAVITLARSSYLTHDLTAAATIGPEGGSIEIPVAGARIVFPAGAINEPTHIKMTAKAGWNVAYEFCPHGIVFNLPVALEQDLDFTVAKQSDLRTLQAGYFAQGLEAIFADRGKSIAWVSDVRGVALDSPGNPRRGRFFIYHFSGYIFSTGFAPSDSGGDDTIIQP